MSILNNTITIQSILETINNLPEVSNGVELPSLTNPASASELVSGKELIDEEGNIITGTMVDNGAIDGSFDGINTTSYTVPAGYTSGGTVSLTDDIPNEVSTQADLIAQIQEVLASKSAYNTVYIGTAEPTADIGVNGDIYIVRSEA